MAANLLQAVNSVARLRSIRFSLLPFAERMEIKVCGPDQPRFVTEKRGGRRFVHSWYTEFPWLTGCLINNKLFCFPCLLFGNRGEEKAWVEVGVNDWKHAKDKIKKHSGSSCHLECSFKLGCMGEVNVNTMDTGNIHGIVKYNEEVAKNNHIVNRLIECI